MKYEISYKSGNNGRVKTKVITSNNSKQAHLKFNNKYPNATIIGVNSYSESNNKELNRIVGTWIKDNKYTFMGIIITIVISIILFSISSIFLLQYNHQKSLYEIDPINFEINNLYSILSILLLLIGVVSLISGIIITIKIQKNYKK